MVLFSMMDPDELRRQQREKIERARERQAATEAAAAEWDRIVRRMLDQLGDAAWGEAARLRQWHAEWEVYAAVPTHPHFRVSLKTDSAGEPSHFVVKCAAGELESDDATQAALVQTLRRAVEAGPARWADRGS